MTALLYPFSSIVAALCLSASTHEVFLLGAAAIANITFMDPLSSDYLLQYSTVMVLVQCCSLQKAESLFAKDQVSQRRAEGGGGGRGGRAGGEGQGQHKKRQQ